ncbi:hypothetical protein HanRHA438_Chr09g0417651 [Helianthus annuus]|uniref:Uncharacterized protein n=1 Tax=Helianthus annuus TaxID=4232 RepID=A0A9K3I9K7_HELAN|nr:hypothetical protein HanXRQr2_Chr09g0405661 [Helianthus annuus]KAJ0527352.1 hypothetical protein HanHA300_Chr09g0333091 [Helianthus annuus]KAJ0536039.1 hypothetical protein HanIR_Chr09g0437171 [Helianthus annuus]KAJ0543754.1 hypothetical protein HanHA89_Chr09g0354071 [Helianthus annuus]KAJ0708808.1 hypothetical protein HanLR1_Chr09g0333381 [Helianthus annuus]
MFLLCVETRDEPVNVFATPPASPKAVGVETQKEDKRSLSIEVVTPPFVHTDDTAQKPTVQTIDDTLDSPNNLIDPHDTENRGDGKPKSPVAEKPKSLVAEKASGSTATGTGVEDQPTIQPGETELEFYYRSYAVDRGLDYYRPPWTVMKGDDVSNNHSACRELLGSLGTPYETLRARSLPRGNRVNQLSSMLVRSFIIANAIMEDYESLGRKEEETARLRAEAEALVKAAREGAEQLKKEKAAFEKLKQTEAWAATAGLKQELNNLKAANAALLKEKAAAEAAAKEAKEEEARGAKADVQSRVAILEEVTAHVTKVETWARRAEEARDRLTTSHNQLRADRDWMRDHGIGHIVGTVLDAPENVTAVNELKERAREAGFKAGYNECLSHVNPFYKSKFTDERSGFQGIDTELLYAATVNAYNSLSISAVEDIEKCLEAEDYVDSLRLLYEPPEEEETAGGSKEDAGTSGTKED